MQKENGEIKSPNMLPYIEIQISLIRTKGLKIALNSPIEFMYLTSQMFESLAI